MGSAVLLVADEVDNWFSAHRRLSAPPKEGDCTPETLLMNWLGLGILYPPLYIGWPAFGEQVAFNFQSTPWLPFLPALTAQHGLAV